MINVHEFDNCLLTTPGGTTLGSGFVHQLDGTVAKICLKSECNLLIKQNIQIYIFNRVKGECVYSARVISIDGNNIGFDRVKFICSTQKRDDTRVDKTLRYRITDRYVNGDINTLEKLPTPIDITILNISATGMFISCSANFAVGHRFPLVFKDAGSPINLEVEVVRAEKRLRGSNYGCRFIDINPKDADNIFRFVLHEQILQRRNHLVV